MATTTITPPGMSTAMQKQQENLLLTEHFTWPPISLIDDIINMTNEVLYRCTSILDTELSSLDPALLGFADRAAAEKRTPEADQDGNPLFPEAKLEIEEGVLKLETLVENALDRNFDRLEIWTLRNVFSLERGGGKKEGEAGKDGEESVGKWMRLAHYENVNPPKNRDLTPEALHTLRRKLQETQKLHTALLAEKARNDALISKLRSLLQGSAAAQKQEFRTSTSPTRAEAESNGSRAPFAFLTHSKEAQALGIQALPAPNEKPANPSATTSTAPTTEGAHIGQPTAPPSHTPLTTHTQFTVSQLPYLRTLLANLRPHLAATALPTTPADGEKSAERKTYIESQSKRILERRGVDTRDGVEGAVEGARGGNADEVRALEGMVKALAETKGMDVKEEGGREDGGDAMDLS